MNPSVMKALTHITAGRTAIKALLIAIVLTAGIAGTAGTVAAETIDGKGNDPFPAGLYSLDGKGNDAAFYAFPINNVTVVGYQASSIEQLSPVPIAFADASVALGVSQDMDPY